jgi:hypothetical protein
VRVANFIGTLDIAVAEAGWCPLGLLYFEKRNTSTLQFY